MKIGKKFNTFSKDEYFFYIDNYQNYSDFNSLGLYRSIKENENLAVPDKIAVRDYANRKFQKFYNFLQIKDPVTFFAISTLDRVLTKGDEQQVWNSIWDYQHAFLLRKRIKHRNFGDYSKHNCGYENCPLNGMMIKQGTLLSEGTMTHFSEHRHRYNPKFKSERRFAERKRKRIIIQSLLDDTNGLTN